MNINLIVLGSLFILTLFGVGESVYKKIGLSKLFILICLGLLIGGLYVPNLKIKDVSFSISGFLLPALFCLILAFRVRSATVFVDLLISGFVCLLLRLVFVEFEFVPNGVLFAVMSALGFALALFSKDGFSVIISSFFGFIFGNIIFELIKYGNINMLLESQFSIAYVLVCLASGLVFLFFKKSLLAQMAKNKVA